MTPEKEQQVRDFIRGGFIDENPSNNIIDSHVLDQLRHMYNDIPIGEWKGYIHCLTDNCVHGALSSDFVIMIFQEIMTMLSE